MHTSFDVHRWMLDRLKNVKEFEGNKQYVSELLSILMQSSTANQIKLATTNGIDALLSCVFPYKGRNARSDGEEEYVANLFGCLCSCLMPAENKVKFMQVSPKSLCSCCCACLQFFLGCQCVERDVRGLEQSYSLPEGSLTKHKPWAVCRQQHLV